MKLLKKIKIRGYEWKVVATEKGETGGNFSFPKRQIKVDIKSDERDSIFLHELMEIIMVENRMRYDGTSDNHFRFFFTHDEFTKYVEDLYALLKDNGFIGSFLKHEKTRT